MTEVTRSNGTKTEVSYDAEDHITKIVNTCGSCGKVISTYEYKYNDQGYVEGETATELEAGTRSEERRVGKECSEPCRSRWSPYH